MAESLKSDIQPTYGTTIIGLGVFQNSSIDIRHGRYLTTPFCIKLLSSRYQVIVRYSSSYISVTKLVRGRGREKDTQILFFFIEMSKVITFSNKLTTNI